MTSPWSSPPAPPDYRPRFPERGYGIGILGCGQIAQSAHLPAYAKYDQHVAGVWSRSPSTTAGVPERFPFVKAIASSPEELLADPEVEVVDIATPTEYRLEWVAAAVDAGKHVLAQKPLTTDLVGLADVLALASARGVRVAVNQNGRWAPAWRLATMLVEDGAIGEIIGVTHLHDKPLPPIAGTPFDQIDHMLLSDYLVHWTDITRCWLRGKQAASLRAFDARTPGQPASARNPQSATIRLMCTDGATAVLRIVGDVRTPRPRCPFWIHGSDGTLRGSVLGGSDFLELERGETSTRFALEGQWFVDGFAGTMGELMCAIAEDREPSNSAADNIATVTITLAAQESAGRHGQEVDLAGLAL